MEECSQSDIDAASASKEEIEGAEELRKTLNEVLSEYPSGSSEYQGLSVDEVRRKVQCFLDDYGTASAVPADVLILSAEFYLRIGFIDLAESVLQFFQSECAAPGELQARALLCRVEIASGKLQALPQSQTSLVSLLQDLAKTVSAVKGQQSASHIVHNASLLFWKLSRPSLRRGSAHLVVDELGEFVSAMMDMKDIDISLLAVFHEALVFATTDVDAKLKKKDSQKIIKNAFSFFKKNCANKLPDILSTLSEVGYDVGKLLESSTSTSLYGKVVKLRKTSNLSCDKLSALLQQLLNKKNKENATKIPALLECLDLAYQMKYDDTVQLILSELSHLDLHGNDVLVELYSVGLNLRQKTSKRGGFASVDAQMGAVRTVEGLLTEAERSGKGRVVESCVVQLWNFLLPLLEDNMRKQIKPVLLKCADALQKFDSGQLLLRSRLHFELAVCLERSDHLHGALAQLELAEGHSEGPEGKKHVHKMKERILLNIDVAETDNDPTREALTILEMMSRSAVDGDFPQKHSLVLRAATLFSPSFPTEHRMLLEGKLQIDPSDTAEAAGAAGGEECFDHWARLCRVARKLLMWDIALLAAKHALQFQALFAHPAHDDCDGKDTVNLDGNSEKLKNEGDLGCEKETDFSSSASTSDIEHGENLRKLCQLHLIVGESIVHLPQLESNPFLLRKLAFHSFLSSARASCESEKSLNATTAAVFMWNYGKKIWDENKADLVIVELQDILKTLLNFCCEGFENLVCKLSSVYLEALLSKFNNESKATNKSEEEKSSKSSLKKAARPSESTLNISNDLKCGLALIEKLLMQISSGKNLAATESRCHLIQLITASSSLVQQHFSNESLVSSDEFNFLCFSIFGLVSNQTSAFKFRTLFSMPEVIKSILSTSWTNQLLPLELISHLSKINLQESLCDLLEFCQIIIGKTVAWKHEKSRSADFVRSRQYLCTIFLNLASQSSSPLPTCIQAFQMAEEASSRQFCLCSLEFVVSFLSLPGTEPATVKLELLEALRKLADGFRLMTTKKIADAELARETFVKIKLYDFLYEALTAKKKWKEALSDLESAMMTIPRSTHKLKIQRRITLLRSRLGDSVLESFAGLDDNPEVWLVVARNHRATSQQMKAYRHVIEMEDCDVWLRLNVMSEFSEWLKFHGLVGSSRVVLEAIVDLLHEKLDKELEWTCEKVRLTDTLKNFYVELAQEEAFEERKRLSLIAASLGRQLIQVSLAAHAADQLVSATESSKTPKGKGRKEETGTGTDKLRKAAPSASLKRDRKKKHPSTDDSSSRLPENLPEWLEFEFSEEALVELARTEKPAVNQKNIANMLWSCRQTLILARILLQLGLPGQAAAILSMVTLFTHLSEEESSCSSQLKLSQLLRCRLLMLIGKRSSAEEILQNVDPSIDGMELCRWKENKDNSQSSTNVSFWQFCRTNSDETSWLWIELSKCLTQLGLTAASKSHLTPLLRHEAFLDERSLRAAVSQFARNLHLEGESELLVVLQAKYPLQSASIAALLPGSPATLKRLRAADDGLSSSAASNWERRRLRDHLHFQLSLMRLEMDRDLEAASSLRERVQALQSGFAFYLREFDVSDVAELSERLLRLAERLRDGKNSVCCTQIMSDDILSPWIACLRAFIEKSGFAEINGHLHGHLLQKLVLDRCALQAEALLGATEQEMRGKLETDPIVLAVQEFIHVNDPSFVDQLSVWSSVKLAWTGQCLAALSEVLCNAAPGDEQSLVRAFYLLAVVLKSKGLRKNFVAMSHLDNQRNERNERNQRSESNEPNEQNERAEEDSEDIITLQSQISAYLLKAVNLFAHSRNQLLNENICLMLLELYAVVGQPFGCNWLLAHQSLATSNFLRSTLAERLGPSSALVKLTLRCKRLAERPETPSSVLRDIQEKLGNIAIHRNLQCDELLSLAANLSPDHVYLCLQHTRNNVLIGGTVDKRRADLAGPNSLSCSLVNPETLLCLQAEFRELTAEPYQETDERWRARWELNVLKLEEYLEPTLAQLQINPGPDVSVVLLLDSHLWNLPIQCLGRFGGIACLSRDFSAQILLNRALSMQSDTVNHEKVSKLPKFRAEKKLKAIEFTTPPGGISCHPSWLRYIQANDKSRSWLSSGLNLPPMMESSSRGGAWLGLVDKFSKFEVDCCINECSALVYSGTQPLHQVCDLGEVNGTDIGLVILDCPTCDIDTDLTMLTLTGASAIIAPIVRATNGEQEKVKLLITDLALGNADSGTAVMLVNNESLREQILAARSITKDGKRDSKKLRKDGKLSSSGKTKASPMREKGRQQSSESLQVEEVEIDRRKGNWFCMGLPNVVLPHK